MSLKKRRRGIGCANCSTPESSITCNGEETEVCDISTTTDLEHFLGDSKTTVPTDSELISDFNENNTHVTPTTSIVEDLVHLDHKMQRMQISCGQLVRKCLTKKSNKGQNCVTICQKCHAHAHSSKDWGPKVAAVSNSGFEEAVETTSAYISGMDSCLSTPFANRGRSERSTHLSQPRSTHLSNFSTGCPSALSSPCASRRCPNTNLDLAKISYVQYRPGTTTICTTLISNNPFCLPCIRLSRDEGLVNSQTSCKSTTTSTGRVKEKSKKDCATKPVNWVTPMTKAPSNHKSHSSLSTKRRDVLRKRAERLRFERQGATTDDDAASDLKVGRYWTKEERIKHLQRSRERQKYRNELLERKRELAKEKQAKSTIVDLAHNKAVKKHEKQLLDKFTTIQEHLAHHGSNTDIKKLPRIFSVTTV